MRRADAGRFPAADAPGGTFDAADAPDATFHAADVPGGTFHTADAPGGTCHAAYPGGTFHAAYAPVATFRAANALDGNRGSRMHQIYISEFRHLLNFQLPHVHARHAMSACVPVYVAKCPVPPLHGPAECV